MRLKNTLAGLSRRGRVGAYDLTRVSHLSASRRKKSIPRAGGRRGVACHDQPSGRPPTGGAGQGEVRSRSTRSVGQGVGEKPLPHPPMA